MKKTWVLLALVFAFGGTSVYAGDGSAKALDIVTVTTPATDRKENVLTVDEAVKKAIDYSPTLKTLSENNVLNEVEADDTHTDLVWATEYVEVTNLNVEFKNLMKSIKNYDTNVEIQKEKIRLNVIELFAGIISAEDNVSMYEEQLELNERELKIAQVKKSLGLMSDSEYNALVVDNNSLKNSKQSIEAALTQAYISLNRLLGQNVDTKYTVELNIDYEPLGQVDLDYEMIKASTSSQTIKELEDAAEIAQYQVDVYSSEYSNDKKEAKENNLSQATRNLSDAKAEMAANVKNTYNSIQTAENTYTNNLATLEQQKKELEIKKLQLSSGKITRLEYDKAEHSIKELENTIRQGVYSHYILVCKFNNPDLIS